MCKTCKLIEEKSLDGTNHKEFPSELKIGDIKLMSGFMMQHQQFQKKKDKHEGQATDIGCATCFTMSKLKRCFLILYQEEQLLCHILKIESFEINYLKLLLKYKLNLLSKEFYKAENFHKKHGPTRQVLQFCQYILSKSLFISE